MPDFDAIAAAVALRYAAAQVTPPAGFTNVRLATADLPNALTALPAVLVFPDQGSFETGNGTRTGTHDFLVRFYLGAPKSLARDMVKLRKWLTVLVGQHLAGMQLGGLVVRVVINRWKIGMMTYGVVEYSGIELGVRVITSEPWSPTA